MLHDVLHAESANGIVKVHDQEQSLAADGVRHVAPEHGLRDFQVECELQRGIVEHEEVEEGIVAVRAETDPPVVVQVGRLHVPHGLKRDGGGFGVARQFLIKKLLFKKEACGQIFLRLFQYLESDLWGEKNGPQDFAGVHVVEGERVVHPEQNQGGLVSVMGEGR